MANQVVPPNRYAAVLSAEAVAELSLRFTNMPRGAGERPGLIYLAKHSIGYRKIKLTGELDAREVEFEEERAVHEIEDAHWNGRWYGWEPGDVSAVEWMSATSWAVIEATRREDDTWYVEYYGVDPDGMAHPAAPLAEPRESWYLVALIEVAGLEAIKVIDLISYQPVLRLLGFQFSDGLTPRAREIALRLGLTEDKLREFKPFDW